MNANIMISVHVDPLRTIESWCVMDASEPLSVLVQEALIGVHRNVHDYLGKQPFFVIPLTTCPKEGKIFNNVFWVPPDDLPTGFSSFLVNELFLRKCLPTQIKKGEKSVDFHMLDAFSHIFEKDNFIPYMRYVVDEKACNCIGVFGDDAIHLHRGT